MRYGNTIPTASSANGRLSDQQRSILSLAKTEMITPEVVHRRFFLDQQMDAARSAIRRLCGQPPHYLYLRPEPLDARRVYYCLTSRGARELGLSAKHTAALKKLGRVKRYALSWFIHADQPGRRTLFNPLDYPEEFPVAGHRLPHHPFYMDESTESLRIGMILVDHNAHVRRTVHKTLKPLGRFLWHGWFDEYIRGEAFVVTVLTYTEFQQTAIRRHLTRAVQEEFAYPLSRLRPDLRDRHPLEINVQVIPGLDAVVAFDPPDGPES